MQTQFLSRPGGRIAYDDTQTTGPLAVCVPGMGDTRATYRQLRPLLVSAGYRVVTADLRGEGESDARWDDYSTVAIASDIVALVRHLDGGPALLISNSYTGGPSLQAAAGEPGLFAALVLIDAFARPQPAPGLTTRAAMWLVGHVPAFWLLYWSSLFKAGKPADFAEGRGALAATMREPGRMAALRAMFTDTQEAGAGAAPAVRCPVLVIMGTRDPDFKDPAGEAAALAAMVGDAQVQMIEGAGHYPQLEVPRDVADVVLPFLRQALAARA